MDYFTAEPDPNLAKIVPTDFFGALGNPLRWQIVQLLSKGAAMSASEVAAQVKRDFDGVSKHLRVMRESGVLNSKRCPVDGRFERYHLPPSVRMQDGFLDYGFCRLKVPGAMAFGGKD